MITLIGKNIAETGLKFMHYGAASQCEQCRFKATCIDSLERGRIYKIKEVKDSEHPCLIHDGNKVQVVDVDRALVRALVESKKAFEGSNIVFSPPECDQECPLSDLCFPEGLYREDKCKIVKKIGKPQEKCPKGLNLTMVLLK